MYTLRSQQGKYLCRGLNFERSDEHSVLFYHRAHDAFQGLNPHLLEYQQVRGFTTAMIQSLNRFELELLGSYMKKLEFLAELRACESILAHKLYL